MKRIVEILNKDFQLHKFVMSHYVLFCQNLSKSNDGQKLSLFRFFIIFISDVSNEFHDRMKLERAVKYVIYWNYCCL